MKTLLQGVNEVLKKVDVIDSVGDLDTLTDSARQTLIDTAVQVLNEVVDELFSIAEIVKPMQLAERTIILNTDDRDYELHESCVQLILSYNLMDEVNNHTIILLGEGGYEKIIQDDRELNRVGLPSYATISPVDGQLFMDRTPTAAEDGLEYKYRFKRDLVLEEAIDVFPFSDLVFRAVVPAAAELWKGYRHHERDNGLMNASLGRAARMLSRIPPRTSWLPNRCEGESTDPFEL